MTFVVVDKIPEKAKRRANEQVEQKPVRKYIEEFMAMGVKCARVVIHHGDYKNNQCAYMALRAAVKISGLAVKVVKRGDDIY